jgi:hypothetical protein
MAATQVVGRGLRAVAIVATASPLSASRAGGQLIPLQHQQQEMRTLVDSPPAFLQRRSSIFAFDTTVEKSSCRNYSNVGAAPLDKVVGCDTYDIWASRSDLRPCKSALHEDLHPHKVVAEIIDGTAIAKEIRATIAEEVAQMKEKVGKVPGLAVVLVGDRTDSETYVRFKKKACAEVGIRNYGKTFPEDVTEEAVLDLVRKYNSDPAVHGILVQLPLPEHINDEKVLEAIDV